MLHPDQQLGQGAAHHLLHQKLIRERGHGRQGRFHLSRIHQVEPHRAGLGLVRQRWRHRLDHHRVTQGGGKRQGLRPVQHPALRHGQAKARQRLFGTGFIKQPRAAHRPRHGHGQWRGLGRPGLRLADKRRVADRVQAVGQTLHRGDAPRQQLAGHRFRQALRQRGHHQAARTVPLMGGHKGIDRGLPRGTGAAVLPGEIQHQQVGVKAAIQQAGKALGLRREIAPDVGVVIERVGHIHLVAQHRVQALVRRRRQSRHL